MKKLIISILISALLLYLSFRGIDLSNIWAGLSRAQYGYLLPAALLMFIMAYLRSLRWGLILSPISRQGQRTLFPISCLGFMAVVVLPIRMGELAKPYMLFKKDIAPFSSGLATVFVERVLDVMSVLGLLFALTLCADLPGWLTKSGYIASAGFVLALSFILFLYFNNNSSIRIIAKVLKPVPDRFRYRIEGLIQNFINGFAIISSPWRLVAAFLMSLSVWVLNGLAIYLLFKFQGLELSMITAFVVLVVTIIGISLPTAPGMIGNFQFACIMALSWYGIAKDPAFVFSMVYYIFGVGSIILLGAVFLPFSGISARDAVRDIADMFKSPKKS